jgi:hypothetical protein
LSPTSTTRNRAATSDDVAARRPGGRTCGDITRGPWRPIVWRVIHHTIRINHPQTRPESSCRRFIMLYRARRPGLAPESGAIP